MPPRFPPYPPLGREPPIRSAPILKPLERPAEGRAPPMLPPRDMPPPPRDMPPPPRDIPPPPRDMPPPPPPLPPPPPRPAADATAGCNAKRSAIIAQKYFILLHHLVDASV